MAISLTRLIKIREEDAAQKQAAPVSAPVQQNASQPTNPPPNGQEFNVGLDFNNFEKTIAAFTENAKNLFQTKLLNLVGNKKVFLRGSKGYGQPIKDYTINVKSVSIDFYYDRYVVVFKDENEKEYFLEPGYKLKILGRAEASSEKPKKKKDPIVPIETPAKTAQPVSQVPPQK